MDVNENDHLIDAYCGVGTIGFAFAKKVKSLRGMDIIPEAIEDAKANAQRMGYSNTTMRQVQQKRLSLDGIRKAIVRMP